MATIQLVNNGDSGLVARTKINSNFTAVNGELNPVIKDVEASQFTGTFARAATIGAATNNPIIRFYHDSARAVGDAYMDIWLGDSGNESATSSGGNIGIGNRNLKSITPSGTFSGTPFFSTFQGDRNIGIGFDVMESLTGTGPNLATGNIGIGERVLNESVDGSYHIAMGFHSMRGFTATTAQSNVAIGVYTLENVTNGTASYNTFIGDWAGRNIAWLGDYNVGIGQRAMVDVLWSTTNNEFNTGVGASVMRDLIEGSVQLSALGVRAGSFAGGSFNTYAGAYSGFVVRGQHNSTLGSQAGHVSDNDYALTTAGTPFTGDQSTFIGYRAGYDITTPAANNITVIGSDYQPILKNGFTYMKGVGFEYLIPAYPSNPASTNIAVNYGDIDLTAQDTDEQYTFLRANHNVTGRLSSSDIITFISMADNGNLFNVGYDIGAQQTQIYGGSNSGSLLMRTGTASGNASLQIFGRYTGGGFVLNGGTNTLNNTNTRVSTIIGADGDTTATVLAYAIGGDITQAGGNGSAGASAFNSRGGDLYFDGGLGAGTGRAGEVRIGFTRGNVGFFGADFSDGDKIIFIGDATAIPSGNPTGGGFLYVSGTDLIWKDDGGTATALNSAGLTVGADNQIPFSNNTGDGYDHNANFTFNGNQLFVEQDGANQATAIFRNSSGVAFIEVRSQLTTGDTYTKYYTSNNFNVWRTGRETGGDFHITYEATGTTGLGTEYLAITTGGELHIGGSNGIILDPDDGTSKAFINIGQGYYLSQKTTAPATPSADRGLIYFDTIDEAFRAIDDGGVKWNFTGKTSGSNNLGFGPDVTMNAGVTGSLYIGDGGGLSGTLNDNNVVIGQGLTGTINTTMAQSVVIGQGVSVSSTASRTVAIGASASVTHANTGGVAIGYLATINNTGVAIGNNTDAGGAGGVAIGDNAGNGVNNVIAIGRLTGGGTASGGSILIGQSAGYNEASGSNAIIIGNNSHATGVSSMALGQNLRALGTYSSIIGMSVTTDRDNDLNQSLAVAVQQSSVPVWHVTGRDGTTTDATPTGLGNMLLVANRMYTMIVMVSARNGLGTENASYVIHASVRTTGSGIVIESQTNQFTQETTAGMNATVAIASGLNLEVEVTGVAATTIDWVASVQMAEIKAL